MIVNKLFYCQYAIKKDLSGTQSDIDTCKMNSYTVRAFTQSKDLLVSSLASWQKGLYRKLLIFGKPMSTHDNRIQHTFQIRVPK